MTTDSATTDVNDAQLLSIPAAASILGVGRSTVYELMSRGELRTVKIGRCRRVPRATLTAFVDGLSAQAE